MPAFWGQFLLSNASEASASRSTVLRPLGWLIGLCAAATLGVLQLGPDRTWLLGLFGTFTGFGVAAYLGSYVYCLIKNPEMLRTEKYSIQKLAIEKGFIGDSLTGVFEDSRSPRQIDSSEQSNMEKE